MYDNGQIAAIPWGTVLVQGRYACLDKRGKRALFLLLRRPVMTHDELYIIKLNIARWEEILELDVDAEKQLIVEQLIAEAKELLATADRQVKLH
jgi:hypothetical protein